MPKCEKCGKIQISKIFGTVESPEDICGCLDTDLHRWAGEQLP